MIKIFFNNKILFFSGVVLFFLYFFIVFLIDNFTRHTFQYSLAASGLLFVYLVYFVSWQKLRNFSWHEKDLRLILFFSAIFIATVSFIIPWADNDFYHYFFEDISLVRYHQNPFFTTPNDLPFEPLAQLSFWRFLPTQHGPLRLFIMAPAAFLSGGNIVIGFLFYKIIFVAFLAGCNFLIYKILIALKVVKPLLPLLLFAWNPLIIYETFASGGTDILMVFWFLLSIYFLIKNRFFWSIAALTLSVLIKYVTVIFIPFFLLYFLTRLFGPKEKIISLIKYLFLIVVTILIFFIPFWRGLETLSGVMWVGSYFSVNSFPGFFSLLFFLINPSFEISSFKIIFETVFLFIYLFILFKFFKLKNPKPKDLIYYCFLISGWFLILGKFWFYPKYLIWLLPLVFLLDRKYYPLAVFLTGMVTLSPLDPPLIIILLIPPVLIFSIYYFIKDLSDKVVKL